MRHKTRTIHFIGIGGSGMSGIAEVLLNLGYTITGSDLASNTTTQRLEGLGAHIYLGHDPQHVKDVDLAVYSSAIDESNPEMVAARAVNIPVMPRAQMLAELMRLKRGIAIAGTHGKTTTTSLIAFMLAKAGLDPTYVIGGRLLSTSGGARLGSGSYLVAEADESDGSFLHLAPLIAVVTNIDADHMATYGHNIDHLRQAFLNFIHRIPFYGMAVLCADCANLQVILPSITKPYVTYGFAAQAQYQAKDITQKGRMMHFTAQRPQLAALQVHLNLGGMHNVQNALAAIAVASELEIPDDAIVSALEEFAGVARRFESCGNFSTAGGSFTLIDDYGHHPTEIAATLAAARAAYPGCRILLAFQPHRFSRTRDLFEDFVRTLAKADALILADIYSAGEAPLPNINSQALAAALTAYGMTTILAKGPEEVRDAVLRHVQADDVVIIQGAGSIGTVPQMIKAYFGEAC